MTLQWSDLVPLSDSQLRQLLNELCVREKHLLERCDSHNTSLVDARKSLVEEQVACSSIPSPFMNQRQPTVRPATDTHRIPSLLDLPPLQPPDAAHDDSSEQQSAGQSYADERAVRPSLPAEWPRPPPPLRAPAPPPPPPLRQRFAARMPPVPMHLLRPPHMRPPPPPRLPPSHLMPPAIHFPPAYRLFGRAQDLCAPPPKRAKVTKIVHMLVIRFTVIYLVMSALFGESSASNATLRSFGLADVAARCLHRCVVLVNSTAPAVGKALLHEIQSRISEAVDFGELNESSPASKIRLSVDGPTGWFFVVRQRHVDRTCLLAATLAHVRLEGASYSGSAEPEEALDFINSQCNTFLALDGGLNRQGRRRAELLVGVFSVGQLSASVPYADVRRVCANLTAFFRTAECESAEGVCEADCDAPPTPPTLPHCDELDETPTAERFFAEFVARSRPLVVRGGAQHWPALRRWSNEYLRATVGARSVHVKLAPPVGEFEGVEAKARWSAAPPVHIPRDVLDQLLYPDLVVVRPHGAQMSFNGFLDLVEKRTVNSSLVSAYLEYSSLSGDLVALKEDVVEPAFARGLLSLLLTNVWLSDGNTLGKLHMDPFDNVLVQLSGRKQVTLIEPHKNERLYEGHMAEATLRWDGGRFGRDRLERSTAMTMSPVDLTRPDHSRFPLFDAVRPLNCTIAPGDALYLPAFWWHEVQSFPQQGRNLAVNFWYEPFLTKEFPCADCRLDVNAKYRHLL